jgi:DNA-directed RNA polymerase specialized sigma24 family protein
MPPAGSVTHWLQLLRAGNVAAARQIWERYWTRLIGLARKKLHSAGRLMADHEDVVLSVFDTVFRGIEQGRFPKMRGRQDLWRVLVTVTARKSLRAIQQENRLKNGGGRVIAETDLPRSDDGKGSALDRLMGREPSPEFAEQVADECRRLLALLDDTLRPIAIWKMESYTNAEIAAKLSCIESTVERKVRMIRSIWEKA